MRKFLSSFAVLASLGLAPAQAATLDGDWTIMSFAGAPKIEPQKTEFKFLPEGRMAATLGCNRMIGGAKIAGKTIKIGPVATTQMACPPPLDQLEHVFAVALEKARRFKIDGATLTLFDAARKPLVTLQRPK